MKVKTITHVITTDSDECLYLNNQQFAEHAYLSDMIKMADGQLVKLEQIKLSEEQSDKITPAGVGPIWPETLEELIGEAPTEDVTESQSITLDEPMMKWFDYKHLPVHLQEVSVIFHDAADTLIRTVSRSPERTVALRKLLEAKDAAVRANLP